MPDQSAMRRIHRERVLLAGGGRALVLQVAHPKVAAGVAQYSGFPRDALRRLRRTLDLSLAMVYGTEEEAAAATGRIRGVHRRVRGVAEGEGYRADDPRLLLWVHATLVDTTLLVYERFVRPLDEPTRRRYYRESTASATALGVTGEVLPPDLDAFRGYVRGMLEGGELRPTEESRRLVPAVLRPPVPVWMRPAAEGARLLTLALLPSRIRDMFDLHAGPVARATLEVSSRASRAVLPALPRGVRTFSASRKEPGEWRR